MFNSIVTAITKFIGFFLLLFNAKKSGEQKNENEDLKKNSEVESEQLKIAARSRAFPRSILDRMSDTDNN